MAACFPRKSLRPGLLALSCLAAAACSRETPDAASLPSASKASSAVAEPSPPPQIVAGRVGSAAQAFEIETFLQPDRPLKPRDYVWDAEGAPKGALRIVVDIAAQRLYVYRGGVEIGRSTLIYGADDKPTPTGTFPILEKDADHVSNLYDAEMPYMLRLTWDGIAIHGSEVDEWAATNGCIGVPDEFAALLFAEAKLGDQVFVTNGWMTDIYDA